MRHGHVPTLLPRGMRGDLRLASGPTRHAVSVGRGADRVSDMRAALAERLWFSLGRIAFRLVLDFRVQFAAEQDHRYRQPDPQHEADHGAERAVGLVEGSEIGRVVGKGRRKYEPTHRGESAAPADPAPLRLVPTRAVTI